MKSELLAPAGSIEGMRAAIAAGSGCRLYGRRIIWGKSLRKYPEEEGLKEPLIMCISIKRNCI